MVAGSGTGLRLSSSLVGTPSTEVTAVEAKPELLLAGATLSDVGQATIPQNIIKTHKTRNNFFILSLLKYILLKGLVLFLLSHFHGVIRIYNF